MAYFANWMAATVAVGTMVLGPLAQAADKVRLVNSTRMPFEMFACEQAINQGFFKDEGLDVEMIYAAGGAETVMSLMTGGRDIGVGVASLATISSYVKGGKLKIIANTKRGAGDLFWYVPADSPIKKFEDLAGHEMVYSRPGSTTHTVAQFMLRNAGIDAKLVSVGGMSSSRTQVMSGQVATGWSTFPVNAGLAREGKIRIIATGDRAEELRDVTIRGVVANADWLAENRDVAKRFMRALWRGQLYNYNGGEEAFQFYADTWKLDVRDAKRAPEFVPFETVTFAPVSGLDMLSKLAVEGKFISKPLTEAQKKDLVDIVYEPKIK